MCKKAVNKIAINGGHLFACFYVCYDFCAFNFAAKQLCVCYVSVVAHQNTTIFWKRYELNAYVGGVCVSMCATYKVWIECILLPTQHAFVHCYSNTYIFKCVLTHIHAQQQRWWLLEKLNGNTNTIFRLKSFCFIDICAFSLHCSNTKPNSCC